MNLLPTKNEILLQLSEIFRMASRSAKRRIFQNPKTSRVAYSMSTKMLFGLLLTADSPLQFWAITRYNLNHFTGWASSWTDSCWYLHSRHLCIVCKIPPQIRFQTVQIFHYLSDSMKRYQTNQIDIFINQIKNKKGSNVNMKVIFTVMNEKWDEWRKFSFMYSISFEVIIKRRNKWVNTWIENKFRIARQER